MAAQSPLLRIPRTSLQTIEINGVKVFYREAVSHPELVGRPHDQAQLLEHQRGHGDLFAALDRAFELPHQQRLGLWRKLCEVGLQSLDRLRR